MLDLIKKRYSPAELPYHIIVPSLPGYVYSSVRPLDKDYSVEAAAGAMNSLLVGLGFGGGYIAQSGDLGSFISRILARSHNSCRGMHATMMGMLPPQERDNPPTDLQEIRALASGGEFLDTGSAFLLEQGQRTATIGLVLSSSPLALLSWWVLILALRNL